MLFSFALTLSLATFQQTACQPGQVLEVARGRDYTLDICGMGVVALRGVEPPLGVADGFFSVILLAGATRTPSYLTRRTSMRS